MVVVVTLVVVVLLTACGAAPEAARPTPTATTARIQSPAVTAGGAILAAGPVLTPTATPMPFPTPWPTPTLTPTAAPESTVVPTMTPVSQQARATETPSPAVTPTTPAISLDLIVAEVPADIPAYDRDDWSGWRDADGDCQNTRAEVLIDESRVPVTFKTDRRCLVVSGEWLGVYTGTVVTEASNLDIDHLVPLNNAHRSGAWAWTRDRKREYANDLAYDDHLIAVTAGANRAKGANGPEQWRPPNTAFWCDYATVWIEVKQRWGLTATRAEATALTDMLATCGASVVTTTATPVAIPTQTVTPRQTAAVGPTATPASKQYPSCDAAAAAGEERVQGSQGDGRGFAAAMVPSARDGDKDGVVCER